MTLVLSVLPIVTVLAPAFAEPPVSPIFPIDIAAVSPVPVSLLLTVKSLKAVVTPIFPVKVSVPAPLNTVKSLFPLAAPSIVLLNSIAPSLVVLSELTVTSPLTITGPVNVMLGLAAPSAVLIFDALSVIPSGAVIDTEKISSAAGLPISPIVTVSVVVAPEPVVIVTVSLL